MIDRNTEVRIYGPYDYEKKHKDSPYITIFHGRKKAKLTNTNTEIDLEEIPPHFFASKKFTFADLKIIREKQLTWSDNTRSRSPKKKQETMELIIKHGTELFTSKIVREFSMRKLARRCGMTVGNLYAYVDSKRDLWYAITQRNYDALDSLIDHVIQDFKGSIIDLLETIIRKFIDFSRSDYARHNMMFFSSPPPPPKTDEEDESPPVGQNEEDFEEKKTLNKVIQIIKEAKNHGEIEIDDPKIFTYFIFGVVQGNILEGYEYAQRIISDEIKAGVKKSEKEWKIFRKETENKFDKLLFKEIDRCLRTQSKNPIAKL